MNVQDLIKNYIVAQPEPKRSDMQELHDIILGMMPDCKLWFLDGRDESGRMVSNPNIGYGVQTTKYADGRTREFYQIGVSANTTGMNEVDPIVKTVMEVKDKSRTPFLNEAF
ncbi:MAG: hypothetical protein KF893_04030 [Caldilineaceae bacterium]|nr:hypothetical protein [Caldilineaceae bacterium]